MPYLLMRVPAAGKWLNDLLVAVSHSVPLGDARKRCDSQVNADAELGEVREDGGDLGAFAQRQLTDSDLPALRAREAGGPAYNTRRQR